MTREEFLKVLPQLARGYKSSSDVVKKLKKLNLLIIVGPSGAGKTSIINQLGLQYVISDTTRERRPGEKEGLDFYFRQDYHQIVKEMKNGEFAQVAVDPSGDLKATKASYYPGSGTAIMAVVADVVPIFRSLGFARTISVFVVPPNFEEWTARMGAHSLSGEQLSRRLAEARRSLLFALSDKEVHFVLNDNLECAVAQIQAILDGKINNQLEEKARISAKDILLELGNNAG